MKTAFCILASLVIVGSGVKLMSAEPSPQQKKQEQVSDRPANELIDALGNQGVKIVYANEDDPYLVIPKTFNWAAHQDLRKTIDELLSQGVAAFPDLAAHAKDDRFSCFVVMAVERPHTVGWVCEQIIKRQIDVSPYSVKYQGELVPRYELEHRVLSENKVSSWAEWWEKHKDKSLLEMQIAVAESSLSTLKNAEKGSRLASWGSRQVKGIEQLVWELKQGNKPKAGPVSLDIRLVNKTRVTTRITETGNEERYYFNNGK